MHTNNKLNHYWESYLEETNMDRFLTTDFYWRRKAFCSSDDEVERTAAVLNELTIEQKKAVRLYGRSRYEEGWDDGNHEGGSVDVF